MQGNRREGGFMLIPSSAHMRFLSCKFYLGTHRPQAEMDVPNCSWVARLSVRQGTLQVYHSSTEQLTWNEGQGGSSGDHLLQLYTPRRQDWVPKFPWSHSKPPASATLLNPCHCDQHPSALPGWAEMHQDQLCGDSQGVQLSWTPSWVN